MESNWKVKNKHTGQCSGSVKEKSVAAKWGYLFAILVILLPAGGCGSKMNSLETAVVSSEYQEIHEAAGQPVEEDTEGRSETVQAGAEENAVQTGAEENMVQVGAEENALQAGAENPDTDREQEGNEAQAQTEAAQDQYPDRNDAEQEMLTQNKAEEKEEALNAAAQVTVPAEELGLHLSQKTVEVPGLEHTYRILYLTDTHIIYLNAEETEQELQNALPRAVDFRNSLGISSADQFPEWIRFANDNELDAVLLGGDIIDYPSAANINYLNENLFELKVPWLYVPGNHDWTYPWEYMTEKSRNEYLVMLEELMGGNTAVHSLEFDDLVIAGTNNSSNQIESAALEEMKHILSQEKPVVVMQHVPFATVPLIQDASAFWSHPVVLGHGIDGGIYPNETSLAYMQQLFEPNGRAALILAGHIHMEHEDILAGGILQLTGGPGYKGEALLLTLRGTGGDDDGS